VPLAETDQPINPRFNRHIIDVRFSGIYIFIYFLHIIKIDSSMVAQLERIFKGLGGGLKFIFAKNLYSFLGLNVRINSHDEKRSKTKKGDISTFLGDNFGDYIFCRICPVIYKNTGRGAGKGLIASGLGHSSILLSSQDSAS
jgi:hypothetical protein